MTRHVDTVPDRELIRAAKAGDLAAFGELIRRHQAPALRIATLALGSPTEAEDVVQEAFVKAHRALERFRDDSAFRPWLFRIVDNTAKNRHRRVGRQRRLAARVAARGEAGGLSPDEAATHRADHAVVVEAINRLRPADRLILTYRWYEQLTEAEIAVALDCRPGTVKSRLNRAMGRLRGELGVVEAGSTNEGSSL